MGKPVTVAEFARQRGDRKVVFTNGCFDILHAGHVAYLQSARALGDLLAVGLNSDESVRRLKGPNRPVNRQADRAAVLAALTCVDFVIIFEEDTPQRLIAELTPDLLVKGGDWSLETIVGADHVRARGGEVRVIPFVEKHSSTRIIERTRPRGVAVIIPARYGSTRFPGKPLAPIAGHPMIEWVCRQARAAPNVSAVVVATDDERIAAAVRGFGGEVAMTGECASGSDRVAQAAAARNEEIIVNVQGDEPLLAGAAIAAIIEPILANPLVEVATGMVALAPNRADDPNNVKVVLDDRADALYFSRAPIPAHREPVTRPARYCKHLGIYVYRRDALDRWAALPPNDLEEREKLEQLRWLAAGGRIRVTEVACDPHSVDVPADVTIIEERLRRHPQENIFA